MHVLLRGASAAAILMLSSCVGIMAAKRTYDSGQSSSAAKVNGADVRLRVKPEGTAGGSYTVSAMVVAAAVATLDGPFRWRIEATGVDGKHESIILHRLKTRTSKTQREEWYPASHLGRRADFVKLREEPGKSRARYDIPGLLKVKPREDGALEILADLTVVTTSSRERKLVKFTLDPADKREDEFLFLPAEIVKNIGSDRSTWDDQGWD
jgi:hypothetical protein